MKKSALILCVALLVPSHANATRTITSPYVDPGVLKMKLKGGATHDDDRPSRDGAWSARIATEYGFTQHFSLEVEGNIDTLGDQNETDYTTTNIKAKFQLTEKGVHWLDVGARLSYEINHDSGADSAEIKLMLTKDSEKFRHIANIALDREIGHNAVNDINAGLSWGSRYKFHRAFEPGIEIYNNFGAISDGSNFSDQDHSIGPVIYGRLSDNLKYEAGYLSGISDGAVDRRFKAVLEYAVEF